LQSIPKECTVEHYIIAPSEIHFLRFTLEAYEGIGVVTTLDPKLGLIRLSIAPGCEEVVRLILEAEGERLRLRTFTPEVACGAPGSGG